MTSKRSKKRRRKFIDELTESFGLHNFNYRIIHYGNPKSVHKHLRRLHGNNCALCGKPMPRCGEPCTPGLEPTIDHILPVAEGGCDCIANLQLAHKRCNSARHKQKPKAV